MANLIQDFKNNCSNFLYIFIDEEAAQKVFRNAPVILQKRKNQIAYVSKAAQMSKYSYKELYQAIGDEIVKVYGKTPGEVLLDVAEGKNVYSKKNVRRSNSSVVGRCRGIGSNIDSNTGLPVGGHQYSYDYIYDTETDEPIGVFDEETGDQISYFNTTTKIWEAGSTPESDKNSRNMWANNIDWNSIIMKIIALIGSLLGVKKAKNMATYQSDGWYGLTKNTTQNSTNNILPIALLAVAGYFLIVKDN